MLVPICWTWFILSSQAFFSVLNPDIILSFTMIAKKTVICSSFLLSFMISDIMFYRMCYAIWVSILLLTFLEGIFLSFISAVTLVCHYYCIWKCWPSAKEQFLIQIVWISPKSSPMQIALFFSYFFWSNMVKVTSLCSVNQVDVVRCIGLISTSSRVLFPEWHHIIFFFFFFFSLKVSIFSSQTPVTQINTA